MEQTLDELFGYRGVTVKFWAYRERYDNGVQYTATIVRDVEGDEIKVERLSRKSYADALQLAYMAFQPLLEAYPRSQRYDNLLSAPVSQDEELRSNIEVPF